MPKVFLSYKREDRDQVVRFADALKRLDLEVWFDADLASGDSFSEEIDREVREAGAVIGCWNESSLSSKWVRSEALIGFENGNLVPVQIAGAGSLVVPTPFNILHVEDLRDWQARSSNDAPAWRSVIRRIGQLVGRTDLEEWGKLTKHSTSEQLQQWTTQHPTSPLLIEVEAAFRERRKAEEELAQVEGAARARLEQEQEVQRVREAEALRIKEAEEAHARAEGIEQAKLERAKEQRHNSWRAPRRVAIMSGGLVLALLAIVGLVNLGSDSRQKIDAEDPWAALYPWDDGRSDIQTTENGVKYVVIEKGDGASGFPSPADTVTVNYAGRLAADGLEFDSSYERGDPSSFRLNQVIPGWTEGLQKMQVGDQFMFLIPSDLGYGAMGAGGDIPPDADLMFRVALLDIQEALVPDEAAWAKVSPWPTDSNEIIRTPTGLEYYIVSSGEADAPAPGPTDYAVVHFEGRLDDGLVADSTFPDQNPRIFPIEQLVAGWSEMLQAMHKGDRWIVRVPPHLMYGGEGYGRIPPNAVVRFEVFLEEVIPVEATEPPDAPVDEPT